MHIRNPAGLLAFSLVVFFLAAGSSWAKFTPVVGVEKVKDGTAYVLVNGSKAIYIKLPNGSLSAADRAEIVRERLTAFAQKGLDPKSISVKSSGAEARVMVGDSLLLIATAGEARSRKVTAAKLAQSWVDGLRTALAIPPLTASPASLMVPVGEVRTVVVKSLVPGPVSAVVSDACISVDPKAKPGSLVVAGVGIGSAVITVRCGDYTSQVEVSVRKYAASRGTGVAKAVVTGWDVPGSLINVAAEEAVGKSIVLEPGARLLSVNIAKTTDELLPGRVVQITAQVEAGGADYIPAKLAVPVIVENRPLPSVAASWIMYSNFPERILKYQTLFTGRLTSSEESMRLLYHHQNNMNRRVGFIIDVVNASPVTASLHVVEGISRPMVDTVIVGYKAGDVFLENLQKNIGRVIELPPGARQSLVSQALEYPETASGVMDLRQLSGDPLLVRVIVKPEEQRVAEDPTGMAISIGEMDASRIALSDHIYPEPTKRMAVTYTVGKQWQFLRLGKQGIKHATMDKLLDGNYGVIYDIEATIENPSESAQSIEFALEATAGVVSGIFHLDGSTHRIKSLQSLAEATIGKVTVPAGGSRTVSLRTMPLSGSAYPATIIIRPAGTLASMSEGK